MKEPCQNKLNQKEIEILKLKKFRTYGIVFGFIGIFVGVLGISIPMLTNQPFEQQHDSFEFGASIGDFYIQDIDTSDINHSYFINQFKIQGARFSQAEWNMFKEYNLTYFPIELGTPFFYEITIFGASGLQNETYAQSCDNNAWTIIELPILIITSIELDVYRDDFEEFDNFYIDFFKYEPIEKYEYYRFLSDSVDQSMYFQLNGISYNYTSENAVNLFMRYNNVPFIVSAYY